jgi:hypothetical protein
METPAHFEIRAHYARFTPCGNADLVQTVDLVSEAIAYCHANKIVRLLADITRLSGFNSPTLVDRFLLAQEWATAANGAVTLALVLKPEHIDPRHFGIVVAADAGLVTETFTTEHEALEWLMNH